MKLLSWKTYSGYYSSNHNMAVVAMNGSIKKYQASYVFVYTYDKYILVTDNQQYFSSSIHLHIS